MRRGTVLTLLVAVASGLGVEVCSSPGAGAYAKRGSTDRVAQAQVQIGAPFSSMMLAEWQEKAQLQVIPATPSGHNVNALQAIEAARATYVPNPTVYVSAVRFGRVAQAQPAFKITGKLVWVVTFPENEMPESSGSGEQKVFTVAVVEAKTGKARLALSYVPKN